MPIPNNLKPYAGRSEPKRLGVILLIVLANVGVLLLLTASPAAGVRTGPQAIDPNIGAASAGAAMAIAAGYYHTCAVLDGGVKCWGDNAYGQLGKDATKDSPIGAWVSGLGAGSSVTAIAAGGYHTCAVVDSGV